MIKAVGLQQENPMTAKIIDRGQGPEIEGTRITVYDVVGYWRKGWQHEQIAGLFRLPHDDVQEVLLVTANRNKDGLGSLEATIAERNQPSRTVDSRRSCLTMRWTQSSLPNGRPRRTL